MQEFKEHEKREREKFSLLSAAVRDSHEKERAQAEKTKYWSVIGSVVGTCLGILGTTINNRLRMRELRELVSRSASGERLMDVSERLDKDLQSHEEKLSGLIVQVQGALSDSKLGLGRVTELQEASQKLEAVGVKLLSGGEDKKAASAAIASLVKKTDDLHRSVAAYQKNLQVWKVSCFLRRRKFIIHALSFSLPDSPAGSEAGAEQSDPRRAVDPSGEAEAFGPSGQVSA